ncbi:MAG: hypothetical protein J7L55_05005 [Desulfurococcales archaeon]|nr:hypothetical protein [Desulfurococcales archaeon]
MSSWPERNEELHQKLHFKPEPLEYKPIPVSKALGEMNSHVNVAIDLGMHSFLSGERSIAKHMIELEHTLDSTAYQILAHVALTVGGDIDKALGSIPLYVYVAGIDKITDSLKDLAYLSLMGYSPSSELYRYFIYLGDVLTSSIDGRLLHGKSIGWINEEYAVEAIAVLRSGKWILVPDEKLTVLLKDKVYVTGVKENVNDLLTSLGQPPINGVEPPSSIKSILSDIDSMIDIVKLLNDLVHYQLKAQDPSMVEEVMEIEMFVDTLRLRVSQNVMECPQFSSKDKFSLLTLVTRLEDITDAMTYSLTLPARDIYRDVLSQIVESSCEKVRSFQLSVNVLISELQEKLEDVGATVIAVKKKGEWVAVTPYNINRLKASPGDSVLLMFPRTLEEDVQDFMKNYAKQPSPTP